MAELEAIKYESGGLNEIIATDGTNSKIRKSIMERSVVWDHFEKIYGPNRELTVKCKYCAFLYPNFKIKNGTSGLNGHMGRCSKFPHNVEANQRLLGFQKIQGGKKSSEGILVPWKFDQELCRAALARMIIVDELPFRFVEKEGFKNFMNVAQPQFHIPSRKTITRDCFDVYAEEKHKLKRLLTETRQRVCLTTDTWTSLQRINYMCLTIHYIDKDWTMCKRIINFCPIASHKGEDIACVISKCLLDWGLEKVFTITVDNASSNDVAVKELSKQFSKWGTNMMDGNHLHMRCMAHILNLVVQDGLKEVGDSVKRVRQVVRYIRQSPARLNKFKECCELEKTICTKSLCLDVPTRWNSTYLMLKVAQEFEDAFVSYGALDRGLLHYLLTHVCEDGRSAGSLLSTDWENIRHMVTFLETFYELTLKVSGWLYVTSNVHFIEICELHYVLKGLIESEDSDLSSMATNMKKKFDKYWGEPEKMNKMIFIACILDPRYKDEYVTYALVSMYGDEKGEKIMGDVKKYMISLFNDYSKQHSKESQSSSSSSVSSSGNTLDLPSVSSHQSQSKKSVATFTQQFKKHKAESGSSDAKTELDKYLGEASENGSDGTDILPWWKMNSPRFPILAEMARDVLAIPVSSVASESAFSTGGRILDSFRSSLTPKLVQALMCSQDWIREDSRPVGVEEDLDHLEQFELDLAKSGSYSRIDI